MKMHGGVMGLALSVGVACAVTASAEGQESCFLWAEGTYPNDGQMPVTSMSITMTHSVFDFPNNCACSPPTSHPCGSPNPAPPPPPCTDSCTISSTQFKGYASLANCATFVQYPGSNGVICHAAGIAAVWNGYWIDGLTYPTNTMLSIEAEFVLNRPIQAVATDNWYFHQGGWPASSTARYYRTGETVILRGAAGGPGNERLRWQWFPCTDSNYNGVCDEYEYASRNFGDFDASGDVGASDLATMLSAWGGSGGSGGFIDLDDDGVVGASDLGTLLSRWGLGA